MKLLEKSVSASSVFTPRDKKHKEIRLALQFGFSELEKPQEAFVLRLASLLDVLIGADRLVKLTRFVIGGNNAKGLLQKLAGLEAVATSISLGLQGCFTSWRHCNFNDAGHQVLQLERNGFIRDRISLKRIQVLPDCWQ